MSITDARFVWPIGDDTVLIPRTPAITEPYHELLVANHERLAASSPGVTEPTPESTRATLERSGQAWLAGTRLPLAIGVRAGTGHRLVGAVSLSVDSAEVGFWIAADAEGRGHVSRALHAVLEHAFNDLGLHRIEMRTLTTNARSRRMAERFGFTLEGVLREAARFPDGHRDVALYALLADEFAASTRSRPEQAV
ncbi:GNAT family N-acetyltransferase [Actinoplanes philippinensis]|uniref:GNAT family N-acetyltransferase n=1 Tax=Actinoplanes philippinensis TaxID=35752 RepID=UPI00340A870D